MGCWLQPAKVGVIIVSNPWLFCTRPFNCVSLVSPIILTTLNILFWYFSFLKCVISLPLFRIRVWISKNSTREAWYKEDYFILAFVYRLHAKWIYVEHWWNYWALWPFYDHRFDHLVFVSYVWSPLSSFISFDISNFKSELCRFSGKRVYLPCLWQE